MNISSEAVAVVTVLEEIHDKIGKNQELGLLLAEYLKGTIDPAEFETVNLVLTSIFDDDVDLVFSGIDRQDFSVNEKSRRDSSVCWEIISTQFSDRLVVTYHASTHKLQLQGRPLSCYKAFVYCLAEVLDKTGLEKVLTRCGDDQFLLKNEVEKLAALANYGTITPQMVGEIGTVTLDADTFDMVKLLTGGQADKAQQKMKTLLALQNDPIMITGALIANYLDLYRVLLGRRSRRSLADVAKDFGYKGNWNYRLNNTERTASRFKRGQLERCLHILQKLDTDLKSSKLDAELLMQKALCELALAGRA